MSASPNVVQTMAEITEREQRQIDQANSSGKTPVVFIHGLAAVIGQLDKKPAVMGHSTGGLLTQMIADRGLSAASVAIDPGPFRGVLPLPLSALKSASPVLRNPLNRGRAITLTFDQFKYGWANALDDKQARHQKHNESVTEITRIPNRGHSLTIDSGWREVAQTALDFVKRFVQ